RAGSIALESLGAHEALARIAEITAFRLGIVLLADGRQGAGCGAHALAVLLERAQNLVTLLGAISGLGQVFADLVDLRDELVKARALVLGKVALLGLECERLRVLKELL